MFRKLQDQSATLAAACYRWEMRFLAALSAGIGLSRLAFWSKRRLGKAPLLLGLELFVSIALAVYYFCLVSPQAEAPRSYDHNEMNLFLFTRLSSAPYIPEQDLMADFCNWEARLPGQILCGWVDDRAFDTAFHCFKTGLLHSNHIALGGYDYPIRWVAFGFYHALWLWGVFLLLIWYRKDALLLMLGVFAGLMYNFIIPAGKWFYPWDLPTMFFFTWACLLFQKSRLWPLLAVVCIGGLFKETTLCCALLVLFAPQWPWKKRLLGFGSLVVACLVCRRLLMDLYGIHTLFFALNNSFSLADMLAKTWSVLSCNIHELFFPHVNHLLLANAGTLFLLLLIPWRNAHEVGLKFVAACFLIGEFLCGSVMEFRIWYEVLPLGWMMLSDGILSRYAGLWLNQSSVPPSEPAAGQELRRQQLLGAHGLLVAFLLLAAFALWGMAQTPFGKRIQPLATPGITVRTNAFGERGLTHSQVEAAARQTLNPATAGTPQQAIVQARQLVERYPNEPMALNDLALLLATSPQEELRNGPEALRLASRAVQLSGARQPSYVGTLAIAFAQMGQYEQALLQARRACDLAAFGRDKETFLVFQHLLESYTAQLPKPPAHP